MPGVWTRNSLKKLRVFWPVLLILALPTVLLSPSLFGGHTTTAADILLQSPPWSVDLAASRVPVQNPLLFDETLQMSPWFWFTRHTLLAGQLPLWNPYVAGGTPFLAAALPGVLYPLTWLEVALPYPFGNAVVTLLKWWIAGLGMYVFARCSLRLARFPALIATLAFMFSSFMVCWLLFEIAQVAVWLPWVLWATERVIRAPSRQYVAVLAIIVLLIGLAGQPEMVLHVLVGATLYALWLVIFQPAQSLLWRLRRLALWAGGILLGILLASTQLLPTLAVLSHSLAQQVRAQEPPAPPLPPQALLTWLVPNIWGNPAIFDQPWGLVNYNENVFYAGVVTLVLAGVALLALRRRERRADVAFFVALFLVFAALLYGFPLIGWVTTLPILRTDVWTRLGVLAIFGAAALAGFGCEEVLTWQHSASASDKLDTGKAGNPQSMQPRRDRRSLPGLLGWLLLPPALVWIMSLFLRRPGWTPEQTRWVVFWLDVALLLFWATCILLLLRWHGWLTRRAVSVALLGLLLGDLLLFTVPYTPQSPISVAYPQTATITRLQQTIGSARLATEGGILPPDSNLPYQLHDLLAYDLSASDRYLGYMLALDPTLANVPILCCETLACPSPVLLSVASVAYYATLPDFDANRCAPVASGQPLSAGPFVPLWTQGGITLWRNTLARPRFYFAGRVIPSSGESQTLAALAGLSAAGRDAIIEGALPGSAGPAPADPGVIRVVTDLPGEITLQTETGAAQWLVVNEGYDAGWQADVDGSSVAVHPANEMFQAVFVPAGAHLVHLVYRPAPLTIGMLLSALALLVLLALLLGDWALRGGDGAARFA